LNNARARFLSKLSPDLIQLNEQAEKLVDEALIKKALLVYKKLLEYLPDEPYLKDMIRELSTKVQERQGPVAEGSQVLTRIEVGAEGLLGELLKALELEGMRGAAKGLEEDLGALENLSPDRFKHIALDAAVLAGMSENWQLSLRLIERLSALGEDSIRVNLWKLRCLVELENFAEAVALFGSVRWPKDMLLHANFLVGLAYEGLGVREQAKSRFEAVFRADPNYRKVAQKLLAF
jgi:tetratricopeptide (TPR) repeat protein